MCGADEYREGRWPVACSRHGALTTVMSSKQVLKFLRIIAVGMLLCRFFVAVVIGVLQLDWSLLLVQCLGPDVGEDRSAAAIVLQSHCARLLLLGLRLQVRLCINGVL